MSPSVAAEILMMDQKREGMDISEKEWASAGEQNSSPHWWEKSMAEESSYYPLRHWLQLILFGVSSCRGLILTVNTFN